MKFPKINDIILIKFTIRQPLLPNLKEAEMGEETEILEFKTSTAEIPAALDSIVAILNKHQKGILYFGVKKENFLKALTQAISMIAKGNTKEFKTDLILKVMPKFFNYICKRFI